ncbi:restriction endonuclease subunit S [Lactobacillus amylovorus]|uniref:restriction endonuclease subunit S n=1 Tax=Lactobacillus amylovorus TaxID=1604 RepID=UPI0033414E15
MVTWEQRKLGDIANSFEYGLNVAAKKFDGKNKYIRITDIDDSTHAFLKDNLTSPNSNLDKIKNYQLKDGDILFTRTGASVGKTYIYEQNDGTVFYAGFLIRANICTNYDPEFIFQNTLTERYDNYIQIISQRSGQPGVNAKEYAEYTLMCPSLLEQKRISSILKRVDELIILQQRKLNELKEVKKTLLSQLFPSKGQYRPIIRFKKFTNKWTKRKLGNIAKIIGGGTPSTSNHDYWNGNINWYSPTEIGNNIFVNSSNKKISIKGLNNSSAKLLPGGKTILFTSRAGIGNMAIMLTDGCTNQGFQSWVIDDTKIDIYFLYSLGRLLKHDAIRQASGSTFLEISNKEVKKLLLEIPSFTEQKLIGNMLRKIDDDIVRQKERIILITKIKKNLLQKLFV